MTTATSRNRTPRYLQIKAGKFIQLQLKDSSYSGPLKTALGIQDAAPGDATQVVGTGREDAMNNGAVGVVLYYERSAGKLQAAKVLCSPEKADTIFADAIGKQYNGKPIRKVRFPRRRIYTF